MEEYAASDQPTVANVIPPCGLGSYASIFDDFDYAPLPNLATMPQPAATVAGSMFGPNDWWTCRDTEARREPAVAWYRYNHENLAFEDSTEIAFPSAGTPFSRLRLTMRRGFRGGKVPQVRSGFLLLRGTYVARVTFSGLDAGARLAQAFWTQGLDPALRTEMDLEWSNALGGSARPALYATNHDRNPVRGDRQAGPYTVGCVGSDPPPPGPGWYDLMIRFDGATVEYAVEGTGNRDAGESMQDDNDGAAPACAQPRVIARYPPVLPMNVQFGIILWGFRPGTSAMQGASSLEIDFFYHSPANALLSLEATDALRRVVQEVKTFRDAGRTRVNTTGIQLSR